MLRIIKRLAEIGPRYGQKELAAVAIIKEELNSLKVSFQEEFFETSVPKMVEAELHADGDMIPCIGSSLKSGEIESGEYLISALGYGGDERPFNISYSPITDEISVMDFYSEPSVTVSRKSILKISMAEKVNGAVKIEKEQFTASNILIGNSDSPRNIVFAHYDSVIGDGALDNAGAIGVIIEAVKDNLDLLRENLFVFAGNEEISYDDYKTKSGYGFRVFETMHADIIKSAKQIIVIDGVGISEPSFLQSGLDWVLQLKCLEEIKDKVYWLQNDQDRVLEYFHTKADTIDKLSEMHLQEARVALIEKLMNRR
ncbi:MAG: hypothetical protein ACD_15C00186G0004 [uncultured bacterium]|nr:MAG: hypothetical protein ACD_15C00186G0004 [uncultured bacterium]HCU70534.1 hypothetical protein [Candidatus Moranbacteria bacterium]